MCGIAGIVRWDQRPVLEHEIRAMCGAMVHRGPDDEGIYLGDGVALGMRRLSIIDLGNGHQPVSNEDGSVWIVFNGEIYNYRELRRDLIARGHVFRTDSDTETIVHLYEEYGAALRRAAARHVRLRDLGHAHARAAARARPPGHQAALLRRARRRAALRLGAEADPPAPRASTARSNWQAVGHLFTFLATPGDQSIVDGVTKLEPARVAIARRGSPLQHPAVLGRRVRAERERHRRRARRAAARRC